MHGSTAHFVSLLFCLLPLSAPPCNNTTRLPTRSPGGTSREGNISKSKHQLFVTAIQLSHGPHARGVCSPHLPGIVPTTQRPFRITRAGLNARPTTTWTSAKPDSLWADHQANDFKIPNASSLVENSLTVSSHFPTAFQVRAILSYLIQHSLPHHQNEE